MKKIISIVLTTVMLLIIFGQRSGFAQDEIPDPLQNLSFLIGGVWEGNSQWSSGDEYSTKEHYSWGLNGKIIKSIQLVKIDGEYQLRNEGIFAVKPGTNDIVLTNYDKDGGITTADIVSDGHVVHIYYDYEVQGEITKLDDTFEITGEDSYTFKVNMKEGEDWNNLLVSDYKRIPGKIFAEGEFVMYSPSKEIYLETIVDARVQDVWHAWTTEEGMKSFFAPESKIEMKIGGAYEMYFLIENEYGQKGGEGNMVLAIEPEKLLSFTWNAPPQFPELRKQKTFVTLKFYELGDNRTRVTLSHTGWGDGEKWDEVYDYFVAAWGDGVLPSLKNAFK